MRRSIFGGGGGGGEMMHHRRARTAAIAKVTSLDRFHEWALNLPWVVEMPGYLDMPRVRVFAVDCEPLDRRQVWLVTGLETISCSAGIAVILPPEAAEAVETAGWGRPTAQMPAGHILFAAPDDAARRFREVEALALSAYAYATG